MSIRSANRGSKPSTSTAYIARQKSDATKSWAALVGIGNAGAASASFLPVRRRKQ